MNILLQQQLFSAVMTFGPGWIICEKPVLTIVNKKYTIKILLIK
ncbi:hypothetical protein DGWBC_0042 [Dehalogenimonas sp. WBC-2]|nr:hypothetical protein DGWBC_0042 [Dehalogenimonas sp. WBC-2]